MPRIHPITLTHLGGTDARHFASTKRLQDGRHFGRELVGIAVAGCDNHGSAFPLLLRCRGRKKIVGLVTGGLCRREAASRHELRQDIQLLNQLIVEPASGLIALKRPVPVSRGIERVPADKDGARLFAS